MKLQAMRLSGFQSFSQKPTELTQEDITYLIGPNGSGKTAILQALCRLFAFDPTLRRIKSSDFHVPCGEKNSPDERILWIEADFTFPELLNESDNSTVAPHFGHMRLDDLSETPRVRYRLDATLGMDGDIEETFVYVLDLDTDGSPLTTAQVPRAERNLIQVHYLPARRDPSDHITYSTNALLGRLLRSVDWENDRETVKQLTKKISDSLDKNPSVDAISRCLQSTWSGLHKGNFFSDPKITFVTSEIESMLKHLSVSFSPGHDEDQVNFSRLSDGQKSMLYLSLVLSSQTIGRNVLSGKDKSFDPDKLKPPVFTIIALEEPENSLSPHYLGRIVNSLESITGSDDAQALIATHAPSMLRRVGPEKIRYLRLTDERTTKITSIILPKADDDAHKFVREAIQAFPEIYFSRLVVLGEGDSEEIVLPRILRARGVPVDEHAVTVAPLGGRHVNHFWQLLTALKIPHITLLDLDVARHAAGWGRIKYVNDQLKKFRPDSQLPSFICLPHWKSNDYSVRDYPYYIDALEKRDVYFSSPMDLDFALLLHYPSEYGVKKEKSEEATLKAVLGKSHHNSGQYSNDELMMFSTYHQLFKLGSKPAAHINAFANMDDAKILSNIPPSLDRLVDKVISKLSEAPE